MPSLRSFRDPDSWRCAPAIEVSFQLEASPTASLSEEEAKQILTVLQIDGPYRSVEDLCRGRKCGWKSHKLLFGLWKPSGALGVKILTPERTGFVLHIPSEHATREFGECAWDDLGPSINSRLVKLHGLLIRAIHELHDARPLRRIVIQNKSWRVSAPPSAGGILVAKEVASAGKFHGSEAGAMFSIPLDLAGYVFLKTFEQSYREFDRPAGKDEVVYSVPREGVPPSESPKCYRGIGRMALGAAPPPIMSDIDPTWDELAAGHYLWDLEEGGRSRQDFIYSLDDARHVFQLLEKRQNWELIWAARADSSVARPEGSELLGFDVTWFGGDHFSAISDCMCFPHWHGTDPEGKLFLPYYSRLNKNALFDSPEDAKDFEEFYTSHDWTETGPYVIAEIRGLPSDR